MTKVNINPYKIVKYYTPPWLRFYPDNNLPRSTHLKKINNRQVLFFQPHDLTIYFNQQ